MTADPSSPRLASLPAVARARVERLRLAPHPEGGWYRELHRSTLQVRREGDAAQRSALTTILFLLAAGEVSRWHRVSGADEAWHYYEGAPLDLLSFAPDGTRATTTRLGTDPATRVHVIPAGWWQAARPAGDYALVGCTVGPGFDFADFAMLRDLPAPVRPPRPGLVEFELLL